MPRHHVSDDPEPNATRVSHAPTPGLRGPRPNPRSIGAPVSPRWRARNLAIPVIEEALDGKVPSSHDDVMAARERHDQPESGRVVAMCYSDDPMEALEGVRILRTIVDRQEFDVVTRARHQGWSWNDIAEALGKSKQNVWRKHHLLDGESIELDLDTPA